MSLRSVHESEASSIHSVSSSRAHRPRVIARFHPPPPPIYLSLAPISSPSFVPFSQFAPCPRGIATHPARLNLGNRCRIYFTRYQGTPATHSTEHSHGIGIPRAAGRSGWGGGEEKRGKGKRRRRSLVVSVIVKSAEAKGDNRYLSALSLPSLSLPFANPYRRRVHARARTAGRKAERSGQAAYPPTTWHTVTRLQSIKCVRLLWLMHYGAIKNGKYSERRAACARPATGPHSMSDEYVRAARCIAFEYNARRYRRRHARTTIRPRKRRASRNALTFAPSSIRSWGRRRCWKVVGRSFERNIQETSRERREFGGETSSSRDLTNLFPLMERRSDRLCSTANSFPRRQLID